MKILNAFREDGSVRLGSAACAVLCAAAIASSCARRGAEVEAPAWAWQDAEARNLDEALAQLPKYDLASVRLGASRVVPMSPSTLLVGGSYRTPAASLRSALLVSDDGGATWRDSGAWLYGSDTADVFVLDARHAWAVTCWSVEGQLPPYWIFRTADGGKTWARSRTSLPTQPLGIPSLAELSFEDARLGKAVMTGTTGEVLTYRTTDGGDTWHVAASALHDPGDEKALGAYIKTQPTPFRATPRDDALDIQQTTDGGKTWRTIGRLPARADRSRLTAGGAIARAAGASPKGVTGVASQVRIDTASRWQALAETALAAARVERVLYEREGDPHFYVRLRIANRTDRAIGADLGGYWNVIYPNQWGFSPEDHRSIIDERRRRAKPFDANQRRALQEAFEGGTLSRIEPKGHVDYFREFNASGRKDVEKQAAENAAMKYLIVSLDGRVAVTDGRAVESLSCAWDDKDSVSAFDTDLVLAKPVPWERIPRDARIVGEKPVDAKSGAADTPAETAPHGRVDPAPASAVASGLELRLTAPAGTEYRRPMIVPLALELKNTSGAPIPFAGWGLQPQVIVTDSNGLRLPTLPRLSLSPWEGVDGSLAPGASIAWTEWLDRIPFNRPIPAGTTILVRFEVVRRVQAPNLPLANSPLATVQSNPIRLVMKDGFPAPLEPGDVQNTWQPGMDFVYHQDGGLAGYRALHVGGGGRATLVVLRHGREPAAWGPNGRRSAKLDASDCHRIAAALRRIEVWKAPTWKTEIARPDEGWIGLAFSSAGRSVSGRFPRRHIESNAALRELEAEMGRAMDLLAGRAAAVPAAEAAALPGSRTRLEEACKAANLLIAVCEAQEDSEGVQEEVGALAVGQKFTVHEILFGGGAFVAGDSPAGKVIGIHYSIAAPPNTYSERTIRKGERVIWILRIRFKRGEVALYEGVKALPDAPETRAAALKAAILAPAAPREKPVGRGIEVRSAVAALARQAIALPRCDARPAGTSDQNPTGLDFGPILRATGQDKDFAAFTTDHRFFQRDEKALADARKTWALCALLDHPNVDARIYAARVLRDLADPASAPALYAAAKRNDYFVPGSENATLHGAYRATLKESLEKITGMALTLKGLTVTTYPKPREPKVIRSEDDPSYFREHVDVAKVEVWLRQTILREAQPAAGNPQAVASGRDIQIHFTGKVSFFELLGTRELTVIPVHADARFAVGVHVIAVRESNAPIQADKDLVFAIHSPVKLFASGAAEAIGKTFRFSLAWHTGPPDRFSALQVEPVEEPSGALPAAAPGKPDAAGPTVIGNALSLAGPIAAEGQAEPGQPITDLASTGRLVKRLQPDGRGTINAVAFLPDGRRFAAAGSAGVAWIWITAGDDPAGRDLLQEADKRDAEMERLRAALEKGGARCARGGRSAGCTRYGRSWRIGRLEILGITTVRMLCITKKKRFDWQYRRPNNEQGLQVRQNR